MAESGSFSNAFLSKESYSELPQSQIGSRLVVEIVEKTKKIGQDDPRRIIHRAKVGLAFTLVSSIYYFKPLYDCFGQAGMFLVVTVMDVFEYTVGGTLSKCLNRGFKTLLTIALGLGVEYLATLCGEKGEHVLLGILIFILAAATATAFTRFFPNIERRYDYGVVIILTISLMAIWGLSSRPNYPACSPNAVHTSYWCHNLLSNLHIHMSGVSRFA